MKNSNLHTLSLVAFAAYAASNSGAADNTLTISEKKIDVGGSGGMRVRESFKPGIGQVSDPV